MSFCSEFKKEILGVEFETKAERFAFASGVLRVCGSIHIVNKCINIEVENELYTLIIKFADIVKSLYDISIDIEVVRETNISSKSYIAKLPASHTAKIVEDMGLITYIDGQAVEFSQGVEKEYETDEDIKAYLLGVVASCVSITVPLQTDEENVYSGGYHLEVLFANQSLAYDIMNYLAQFDILVKKITRGEMYALYIKDSNIISDFIALFGGSNSVIDIVNIIVNRSVRNDSNRVNNCQIANIDKSIEAGNKQYLAITKIAQIIGLGELPEKLRVIAEIRLEYPGYSLDEIADELGGNISKSGINHRLRKIMDIASKLADEEYADTVEQSITEGGEVNE